MTTKQKIIQYLKFKNLSKREFYLKTGLSNGFLDSGKYIGTDKLTTILNSFPDLSMNWLILNKGEMIKEIKEEEFQQNTKEQYHSLIQIESLQEYNKLLQDLIKEKDKLIIEKERVINLLMKSINK